MEIRWYADILQRRKWVVMLTTFMAVAVSGLGSYLMTPVYSASTMVRIAQVQDTSIDYFDLNYSVRLMNTYAHLLVSGPFLEEVIQRLDLDTLPEELAKSIKVAALPDTELLKITAESPHPTQAMEIANTLGGLLIQEGQKLYSGEGKTFRQMLQEQLTIVEENLRGDRALLQSLVNDNTGQDQTVRIQDLNTRIRAQEETYAMLLREHERAQVGEEVRANSISVVEPAIVPKAPIKPRIKLNITLGALVGLVGGLGLAFFFENLDRTPHSAGEEEAAATGQLLGWTPNFRTPTRARRGMVVLDLDARSPASEPYRILRTSFFSGPSRAPKKILLMTSVRPGTGKSTVLANLAAAMAQAGQKVVVVDSNFRDPSLHQVFDLSNEVGLSNVILDLSRVDTALQKTKIQGLRVLTSGPLPANPADLLGSANMQELIWELATQSDMVLLDSPPISAVADAAVLAAIVDGVLLVAAGDQATGGSIHRALEEMDKAGVKALGLLLNKAKAGREEYYPHHSYATESAKPVLQFGPRKTARSAHSSGNVCG